MKNDGDDYLKEKKETMPKKFMIHLTEKYSNPIVKVNSRILYSQDSQNYIFYVPDTTESYTLKVTCEGYYDYELSGINDKLVKVTLKSPEKVLGIIVGVLSALTLVVGLVLTITGKDNHEKSGDTKPWNYSNLLDADNKKDDYSILGAASDNKLFWT